MTKPELYRLVFKSTEGQQVLADLARYVEVMDVSQPGSAGKLIAHITRMINEPDRAPVNGKVRGVARASGGRITHG